MIPEEVTPEVLQFLKENIETNFKIIEIDKEKLDQTRKNIYAQFGEPYPDYDEFGLKFSLDHLNQITPILPLIPVQIAADYADQGTKFAIDNNEIRFDDSLLQNVEDLKIDINATAIGNLSYAYVNTKFEEDKPFLKASIIKIANFILDAAADELK